MKFRKIEYYVIWDVIFRLSKIYSDIWGERKCVNCLFDRNPLLQKPAEIRETRLFWYQFSILLFSHLNLVLILCHHQIKIELKNTATPTFWESCFEARWHICLKKHLSKKNFINSVENWIHSKWYFFKMYSKKLKLIKNIWHCKHLQNV